MIKIERLDINIVYACNLSCKGCISLSNFKRKGLMKLSDLENSFIYWSKLINPEIITLFGGEPTLHKKLQEICFLIRNHWKYSKIRLITNGYFLNKFDSEKWFHINNFEIQVSVHRKDHEEILNKNIENILNQRTSWKVKKSKKLNEHEQVSWTNKDLKIYKSIFANFIEPFDFSNNKIQPHYSNPIIAHSICGSPNTPVLYKNKLYKCPVVANIIDLTGENWFNYTPCENENNLEDFVKNINCAEIVCSGCPDKSNAVIINHLDKENVVVKNID